MTFRFLTFITVFFSTLTLTADDRPNVLFIAVDDLNHWVSHLGRNPQAKTPNIDRIAAAFEHFEARAACLRMSCDDNALRLCCESSVIVATPSASS